MNPLRAFRLCVLKVSPLRRPRARLPAGRSPGQILVLFAVALVPLLGATGVALDFGNTYMRNGMLQTAVDAGVLAGARRMTTGVPGVDFTAADVVTAMNSYLTANLPGATFVPTTGQLLVWGNSTNANECLSSGINRTVQVANASTDDLWTAQCVQGTATALVGTVFLNIFGITSIPIGATATATAVPVIGGTVLAATIADAAVKVGDTATPWNPGWRDNLSEKGCLVPQEPGESSWKDDALLLPHGFLPDPPCDDLADGVNDGLLDGIPVVAISTNYKGLVNFMGPANAPPPNPPPPSYPPGHPGNSNSSGCHWHEHSLPPSAETGGGNRRVGWNNPTHSGPAHPPNTWPGPGPWNNGAYRKDARTDPVNANGCDPASNILNAMTLWAATGFQGRFEGGPATEGKGDIFVLYEGGNTGNNIHDPLNVNCPPPSKVVFFPYFDAMADPNHNEQIAVHMKGIAALQIECPLPNPNSQVSGRFVPAPMDPADVWATGGSRCSGCPNVVAIYLVS